MPVTKFRTVEEMNAHTIARRRARLNDRDELYQTIREHWASWSKLLPPLDIPKGVHKFRSIEEMNAFKDYYVRKRIEKLRERIVKS